MSVVPWASLNAVKVWEVGTTFVIFLPVKRLNVNILLVLNTTNLVPFMPKMFQNHTNDYLQHKEDAVCGLLEELHVSSMDDHDIVVNVHGTTAQTYVKTQGGDEKY